MRIGNIEFRKPWVKLVDIPIEEELYKAILKSVGRDLVEDLRSMIAELQSIVDDVDDKVEGEKRCC